MIATPVLTRRLLRLQYGAMTTTLLLGARCWATPSVAPTSPPTRRQFAPPTCPACRRYKTEALAPFGIDPREPGILLVIASHEPGSQQQAAQRLGIDRTSMVARIDALEDKDLVTRQPHAKDRARSRQ
jgi:hypothetical protein